MKLLIRQVDAKQYLTLEHCLIYARAYVGDLKSSYINAIHAVKHMLSSIRDGRLGAFLGN